MTKMKIIVDCEACALRLNLGKQLKELKTVDQIQTFIALHDQMHEDLESQIREDPKQRKGLRWDSFTESYERCNNCDKNLVEHQILLSIGQKQHDYEPKKCPFCGQRSRFHDKSKCIHEHEYVEREGYMPWQKVTECWICEQGIIVMYA